MSNEKQSNQNAPRTKGEKTVKKVRKSRYFQAIAYTDSCPDFLYRYLKTSACVCYVLHDKDVYQNTVFDSSFNCGNPNVLKVKHHKGDLKKPHYHIILSYRGPATLDNAQKVFKTEFNIEPNMVEYVNDIVLATRYLTHKDHLEKYQYSDKEVFYKPLFDYEKFSNLHTESHTLTTFKKIFAICNDKGLVNCAELIDYCISLEDDVLFEFVVNSKNLNVIDKYLRGNYFRIYANKEKNNDFESIY